MAFIYSPANEARREVANLTERKFGIPMYMVSNYLSVCISVCPFVCLFVCLLQKWTGGSTSCPVNLIFILEPYTFLCSHNNTIIHSRRAPEHCTMIGIFTTPFVLILFAQIKRIRPKYILFSFKVDEKIVKMTAKRWPKSTLRDDRIRVRLGQVRSG